MPEIYPLKLTEYLMCEYKDGSRGEGGYYDCWGLVRHVRHFVYGKSMLHEYAGVDRFAPITLAKCGADQVRELEEIDTPRAGAIVTVCRKRLCTHVAVCVENNSTIEIMEANPSGIQILPLQRFVQQYYQREIRFYD